MRTFSMKYTIPMIALTKKLVTGSLLSKSISISAIISAIVSFISGTFLGVAISFIIVIAGLTILDFITGVIAAKKKKLPIESGKVGLTAIKFLMLFIWIVLSYHINNILGANPIIIGITSIPLALLSLREFISIGENVEKIYGNKPYIFQLITKMFDLLEFKFLKK